ncbi:hypothetical protein [Stenotrophomonas bentonitica]
MQAKPCGAAAAAGAARWPAKAYIHSDNASVGGISTPGILAITEMTQRLDVDHDNARYLAQQLAEVPGIEVDMEDVHINMVCSRCSMGWICLD